MKTIPPILSVLAAVALSVVSASGAQLINYQFNEGSGSTAANTGTASGADLTLGAPLTGWASGVSGAPGDYAYHGTAIATSYARTAGAVSALNSATAFTVAGWLDINETWVDGRAIFNWNTMLALRTGTGGELKLIVDPFWNSNTLISSSGGAFGNVNGWLFFAATWDGSGTATNKVNFYLGTTSTAAALVSTINRGGSATTGSGGGQFTAGNLNTATWYEAFNGDLDNLQIYNTVLDQSALETIRASAVPEPSTFGLLGLGGLALLMRRRSQKRD